MHKHILVLSSNIATHENSPYKVDVALMSHLTSIVSLTTKNEMGKFYYSAAFQTRNWQKKRKGKEEKKTAEKPYQAKTFKSFRIMLNDGFIASVIFLLPCCTDHEMCSYNTSCINNMAFSVGNIWRLGCILKNPILIFVKFSCEWKTHRNVGKKRHEHIHIVEWLTICERTSTHFSNETMTREMKWKR